MKFSPTSSVAARLLQIGQSALFLALLLIGVIRGALTGGGWALAAASGAMAMLFGAGLATHRRLGPSGRVVWIVAVLVGTVALMQVSADFVWLIFPVWMWCARVLRLPAALMLTAVSVTLVIVTLHQQGQTSSAAVLGPIIGALVAVGLARGALRLEQEGEAHKRLLSSVLESQAEAAALSEELGRVQRDAAILAERTRLSHDIHDTLAQGFSSILLLSRAAARETDAGRIRGLLTQMEKAAAENLTESRRVVYALAPDDLTAGGIGSPLGRMTDDLATDLHAQVTLRVDPSLPRLAIATEVALLRAAQGALANVRRHARAKTVTVVVARVGGDVRLDVMDDGVGFRPTALADTEPTLAGGYGLRSLRARLAAIGGGLAIESEPGQGTVVSITVPFAPAGAGSP